MKKLLSLVLVLVMVLSVASFASAEELTVYHDYQTTANEMETWLPQASQSAKELNVMTNYIDGLVYNDAHGKLVPLAAESWSANEDSTVWTFNIREGMCWVDVNGEYKGDVVAEDWVIGAEWVLNQAKNSGTNSSMLLETVKGAQEYYDFTVAQDAAAKDLTINDQFAEMVGIEATDDYTLVCTMKEPCPYFDTIATYVCLFALPQGMIDELGSVEAVLAVNNETLWYSGPYTVTTYNQGSEKVLTKNPLYWNEEANLFDEVTITMVESAAKAYELYLAGELDRVSLSQADTASIYDDPTNPNYDYLVEARPTKYSYQIHFTWERKNADGSLDEQWNTAVANEAFRKSWYYGLDLTDYFARTNYVYPYHCTNYTYTGSGVAQTTDGVDYINLVMDRLEGGKGLYPSETEFNRVNKELAAQYKAQAIEELTAKGVTFPVEVNYYYQGSNDVAAKTALVLQQMFNDCLGEDYVKFNINTYVSSVANEVRKPQLASIYINGWGADFGDPLNFVGQETYDEPNAYYSNSYSIINHATDEDLIATYKEFTELVGKAKAITAADKYDERLAAFADSEAYFIDHCLTIPCYVDVSWQMTKVNDYTKVYAAYGIAAYRYENYETKTEPYTTADYEAIKAAFEAK